MMKNDLISVREGLRRPRKFVAQLLARPRTYGRAFLRHPHQALFGFPKTVAPPAPPIETETIPVTPPAPPIETETIPVTPVHPWPDLGLWPWQFPTEIVSAKMPNGKPWPRISIVTPSYQQGEFIERTIVQCYCRVS
jgi:hypothetical protein